MAREIESRSFDVVLCEEPGAEDGSSSRGGSVFGGSSGHVVSAGGRWKGDISGSRRSGSMFTGRARLLGLSGNVPFHFSFVPLSGDVGSGVKGLCV